jgi:hypothetical protein
MHISLAKVFFFQSLKPFPSKFYELENHLKIKNIMAKQVLLVPNLYV